MGRSLPVLLLRASAILCAGMLLFAVFGHAHADSYAGDNYGLAPLPPASPAAAASATRFNGDSGSFTPASGGAAPSYAGGGGFSPAPTGAPASLAPEPGFTPAPLSAAPQGGYQTATSGYPAYQAPYQAPPVYRSPLPPPAARPMTDTPPNSTYGLEPSMQMPPAQAPAPAPPPAPSLAQQNSFQQNLVPAPQTAVRQPGDANTPYGYNKGDGETQQPTQVAMAPAYYRPPFQTVDNSPRANSDYVLGTGDKIHLSVFDEPDLSGDYAVDGSGYVRLPLIGQVRAAGYTPPQLEAAIGSALANGYLRSPRVSVEVATYRPFYVIGAVGRPGEYPYVNHMNVLNAIAMAGGFLPSAVNSVVYIRRQGSNQEYAVNADTAAQVHPGDVVRVKTTFFWDAMSLFSPLNGVASIAVAGIR